MSSAFYIGNCDLLYMDLSVCLKCDDSFVNKRKKERKKEKKKKKKTRDDRRKILTFVIAEAKKVESLY
ncbi:hypothetical protein PUN28_018337 [Cardiocondyla obscurior]|uniref:Uncharacterized protein n=1 Tax=Cardiocondyla obscurior TaxID=286306 RepID=A0AAW2EL50_9HYME